MANLGIKNKIADGEPGMADRWREERDGKKGLENCLNFLLNAIISLIDKVDENHFSPDRTRTVARKRGKKKD